ncbi:MAG: site-specific integrase [Candidatus Micrarchaeota archaeon]
MKPTRKEAKQLWPEARKLLEFLGSYLPKPRLTTAITVLSNARKRRFLRRRQPKYGSMNKGFTDEELVKFMNAVEDSRAVLLFTYQAVLGLRIGEVVRLHIKDINLKTKELRIGNEKCDRTDYLPIPPQLFDQTLNFITQNEHEIATHKGYLFWADYYPERNSCPHISNDYARNIFRQVIEKTKLDETYGIAEGKTACLLHRLTTHSLRHYAITRFANKNNGNVLMTSKFARHHNIQTTMTYIHTSKEELYKSILAAQDDGILSKVRRLQEET